MLSAEVIAGFSETVLSARYDNPQPTPEFHHEVWGLCCLDTRYIAIAAPRGHAKAQSLTSKVLTPSGWTTIGSLSVGDFVIGGDGKPARVKRLHPISSMDLYRVTTRDGKSALCNLGHLWNVKNGGNTGNRVTVKSLDEIIGNWKADRFDKRYEKSFTEYRYKIPAPDPVEFEKKDLVLDPYMFGAWLGDGHSAGGRFTTNDPEILGYFPYPTEKQSGKYGYVIRKIYPRLKSLGVLNNKHIPDDYLLSNIEDRLSLLQGLMDTDGTCHRDGNIAYFCNTNKRLIDGVTGLIRSLGGVATENTHYATCNGKRFLSWRVSCKLPNGMNPFRLKRKASRWRGSVNTDSYIVSIEKECTEKGRCISVERETYITDDFLLTHNSTCVTHAYVLAQVLFRESNFVVIGSETEGQSIDFLNDLKTELAENHDLRELFDISKFVRDTQTDIIVQMRDKHQFRIVAKGAEQKLRGMKWKGKRPDLFIGDDMEGDEQVQNHDRREKFMRWVYGAVLPMLSDNGKARIVGTILHMASFLEKHMPDEKDPEAVITPLSVKVVKEGALWGSIRYKAHDDDFKHILWPGKFDKKILSAIRRDYVDRGFPEVYAQEYLNYPIDESTSFFKRSDFLESKDPGRLRYYAAADFAISKNERADFTVISVAGVDSENRLHVVDVRRGRWDALQIIDEMFSVQSRYSPDLFTVETGSIEKSLGPFLKAEMYKRGVYMNLNPLNPTKDKQTRARSFQARMRAGGVYFDHTADWFPQAQSEILRFPRDVHDDVVDSLSWIGLTLDQVSLPQTNREIEDEYFEEMESFMPTGRSMVTGY